MQTNLATYISEHGEEACAKQWGVKPRTVAAYRRGERGPTRQRAMRMVEASNNQLSLEAIFGLGPSCGIEELTGHDTAARRDHPPTGADRGQSEPGKAV